MKKANIILASVMLLTILGSALAFKAARTSQGKIFHTTNAYTTFGTVYTRAGLATFCVPTSLQAYWTVTTNMGGLITSYITTFPPTTTITLTRIGGTETMTIPSYTCVTTTLYTTAAF